MQAILVRDEAAKKRLKKELGMYARGLLVLTAQECKGLEFQVDRLTFMHCAYLHLLHAHSLTPDLRTYLNTNHCIWLTSQAGY